MSSNNTLARDFIKNFNAEDRTRDDNSNSSSSDSDVNYQKNHLSKLQTIIQKATRRTRKVPSGRSSHYARPYGWPRAPSFLEQQLLPGIRVSDAASLFPSNMSDDGQLTIFYKGAVNVYDDISFDKARTIMLMASGKNTMYVTEPDTPEPIKESNPLALCKLQTNIPVATKRSLRLFFEKRRDRRINKILDASMSEKQKGMIDH